MGFWTLGLLHRQPGRARIRDDDRRPLHHFDLVAQGGKGTLALAFDLDEDQNLLQEFIQPLQDLAAQLQVETGLAGKSVLAGANQCLEIGQFARLSRGEVGDLSLENAVLPCGAPAPPARRRGQSGRQVAARLSSCDALAGPMDPGSGGYSPPPGTWI